jgi:glycosyltransferase involved in cell wall biosynthesis
MRRIRLFGVQSNAGIGVHSQSLYQCLCRYEGGLFSVEFFNHASPAEVESAVASTSDTDVNICFFPESFAARLSGICIYYAVFESNRPSPGYEEWLKDFDFIFSPSNWGKNCMVQYGLPEERIFVVPEGVDPFVFHPFGRSATKKDGPTRILMIGKYESRKGYAEALEAFRIAYQREQNMELWLKADWVNPQGSAMHPEFIALAQGYTNLPVKLVSGLLNQAQMVDLYRQSDLFLFPSRCEGWGLPLIEAIASGLPAICCDFGGQSEFLSAIPKLHVSVPYELAPIECPVWHNWYQHADGNYGDWAKISPETLAKKLVEAVRSPKTRAHGIAAAGIIRNRFSWERSADRLVQQLTASKIIE